MVTSKQYIKLNNQSFTLTAVKELTYSRFDQVETVKRKKITEYVQHVFEDKHWCEDGEQQEKEDEINIHVGGSDDDSSTESDTAGETEASDLD